ncbi:DUF5017 domain-containing protein [Parabacteroides sp. FAFU027]|uniref:DUF5017 domain-containing protein n=1 Tax=Parabacteroides sp. FAFU027 TaxID=2922715 RepID=UPI001FAE7F94|nr:DUF5017 domain-containing protein [Parabacteroides sp. FAFU027]
MKKLIFILLTSVALFSCNDVAVNTPDDFTVNTNIVAKAGDTIVITKGDTVNFNFTGNPDYITFFPGTPGYEYRYSGVAQRDGDSSLVYFSTKLGATTGTTGTLTVLASNDFTGTMDSANIKKATWVPVTQKFKLATTTTAVESGKVRIDTISGIDKKRPVYFAFRFVSDSIKTTTDITKPWMITAFSFTNYFSNGITYQLANDMRSAGFVTKSLKNSSNYWYFSNSTLTFAINAKSVGTAGDEDWVISRALDMRCVPADAGLVVKSLKTTGLITSYSYVFTQTGVFTASFVAKNQSYDTAKDVVRQMIVKVVNP